MWARFATCSSQRFYALCFVTCSSVPIQSFAFSSTTTIHVFTLRLPDAVMWGFWHMLKISDVRKRFFLTLCNVKFWCRLNFGSYLWRRLCVLAKIQSLNNTKYFIKYFLDYSMVRLRIGISSLQLALLSDVPSPSGGAAWRAARSFQTTKRPMANRVMIWNCWAGILRSRENVDDALNIYIEWMHNFFNKFYSTKTNNI